MLKITASQMQELGKAMQRQFEHGTVAYLRASFGQWAEQRSDAELTAFIRLAISRAENHGVKTEADVRRYLDYMVSYGQDFDTEPATSWAGDILRSPGLSGTEKMDRIDECELFVMKR